MTRIILVRHGRSMANVADIFAGITETPLTPHGLLQAQAVANYLFEHEKIDKVYASPLSRA
ncbi:MAG: histidine phosphatase family protein, partial [Clostridia bacterium]|nr:histidine phosphatase family protein [Clostridia bacterium]